MNIGIIDDENYFCVKLSKMIVSYFHEREMECHVEYYSSFHDSKKYDCYIIDIFLSEEMGTNVAKKILKRNQNAYIIFISNEDDCIFEVQTLKMLYFIRKSKLDVDLCKALDKLVKEFNFSKEKIEVIVQREKILIEKKNIIYIEVCGRKSTIYTLNKNYETNMSLKLLSEILNSPNFFRINSYLLIHTKYIKELQRKYILLTNGMKIKIKENQFKELLFSLR